MALSLTQTQQDIIAATNKKVSWLFDVDDSLNNYYHWSTKDLNEQTGAIVWDEDDASSTELITNSDNETAISTFDTDGNEACTAAQDSGQAYSGSNSTKLTSNGAESFSRRFFYDTNLSHVTSGKTYKLTVWVYLPSGQGITGIQFRGIGDDSGIVVAVLGTVTTEDSWQRISGNVTVDDQLRCDILVSGVTEDDYIYFDDLSIKEVNKIDWNIPIHWDGEEKQSYDFKIMDFSGVEMSRSKTETGIIAPSQLTFTVSNVSNSFTPSNFEDGTVALALRISDGTSEEVIRRWRFRIKRAEPGYQKFRLICEDFLQKYLRGNYPNLRLLKDLFPSNDTDFNSNVCLPVPIGQAYIPLRSVYVSSGITAASSDVVVKATSEGARCKFLSPKANVFDNFEVGRNITTTGFSNAENNGTFILLSVESSAIQVASDAGLVAETLSGSTGQFSMGSRYYVLGSTQHSYTISNVRSPRSWGKKSEWGSGSYSFNQYTKVSPIDGNNYRMFHPIIADVDNDGTADAPGLWLQGDQFLDMPTKFVRSDTSGLTEPDKAIPFVLMDMGILQNDIDLTTVNDARPTYGSTGWNHSGFNGGWWQKQNRKSVLMQMLVQAHSNLILGEGVELHPINSTSVKTITKTEVLRTADRTEGSFQYQDIRSDEIHDSGEVAWQESGEAQDKFVRTLVAGSSDNSNKLYPSGEVLPVYLVQHSQDAQRIGILHYQRSHNKQATITMVLKGTCLDLQPGDAITISPADYGGTYVCIIDSIKINKDLSMTIRATRHAVTLQNWDTISPVAIAIVEDDTGQPWQMPVSGPLSKQNLGQAAYDMWAKGYVIVGPTTNKGEYYDIQEALNALTDTDRDGLYILSGTYTLSTAICLPQRNIELFGESRGQTIIKNHAGSKCFIIPASTQKVTLTNFTIESQNIAGGYGALIKVNSGSSVTATFQGIDFDLGDAGSRLNSSGDFGIETTGPIKSLVVHACNFNGGKWGLNLVKTNNLKITNNTFEDQRWDGIYIQDSEEFWVGPNNDITGFSRIGIYNANSLSYCKDGFIVNNTVKGTTSVDGTTSVQSGIFSQGDNINIANNVINLNTSMLRPNLRGISIYHSSATNVNSNVITIKSPSTISHLGIYCAVGSHNGTISNNKIKFDCSSTAGSHQGISLSQSNRNAITGNNIDGVWDQSVDLGIVLGSSAGGNLVHGNFTYNVGTRISDAGSSNTESDYKDI